MLGNLPDDFKEGDIVSATDLNKMLSLLRMFAKMIVTPPLEMKAGTAGVVLSAPNIKRGSVTVTIIEFTTTEAFSSDEADATVDRVWSGSAAKASDTVTIRTEGGILDDVASGFTGTAVYDASIDKYRYLPDRMLAVDDGNTPGLFKSVVSTFNASAQYQANKDLISEWELTGSAPDKKMIAFVDSTAYPNYDVGAFQSLGKDTSDLITWSRHLGDSAWIQVQIDGSGDINYSHIGPVSGETTTTIGTTISKPSGSPDGSTINLTSSANAGAFYVLVSHYQPVADEDASFFVRKVTVDSKGHLVTVGAEEDGGTISIGGGGGDDEKLAVVSTSDPGYWEDLHTSWNSSATFELANEPIIYSEQNGDELLLYEDWSTVPGYSASSIQIHGHLSNATEAFFEIVGDSWIGVTEDAGNFELELAHTGPVKDETATTIGTDNEKATGASDSTALDLTATANAGAFWYLAGFYQPTANEDVDLFFRKASFDTRGHLYAVSGESAARTITLASGSAPTPEYASAEFSFTHSGGGPLTAPLSAITAEGLSVNTTDDVLEIATSGDYLIVCKFEASNPSPPASTTEAGTTVSMQVAVNAGSPHWDSSGIIPHLDGDSGRAHLGINVIAGLTAGDELSVLISTNSGGNTSIFDGLISVLKVG